MANFNYEIGKVIGRWNRRIEPAEAITQKKVHVHINTAYICTHFMHWINNSVMQQDK